MTIGNNQMKPPMDRRQFVSKVNLLTTEQELDPRGVLSSTHYGYNLLRIIWSERGKNFTSRLLVVDNAPVIHLL